MTRGRGGGPFPSVIASAAKRSRTAARPALLDRHVAADAAPRDDGDEGPPKDSSDPIALPLCGCPLPEGPHSLALPLLGCPAPGGREPDTEEVQALLRQDFHSFLVRAFATLYGDDFVPGWHIEVLAGKLAAIRAGGKRLVVMIPPRHLKPLAASIALPAWLLGQDPRLAIVNATYAQDLSDVFARDCRAVMGSAWYRDLFPTR
ncbi:MAG TPA: hypothetical protein VEH77_16030, partial [Roseiarcus sp.]|nr:hypothetical protein [Roseiarcus sp.]